MSLKDLMQLKITTASRSEETVIDAPAKVKIITKQQIRERGYINLFDLLRDQPGVDTQAYSHETTYNQVAVRGVVGNNRFLIQQDGNSKPYAFKQGYMHPIKYSVLCS